MTARLLGAAFDKWTAFEGWATSRLAGGDVLDLPLDRLLNITYYWLTRRGDEAGVQRFDQMLWVPPPGEEAHEQSPWSAANETAALAAFAQQVGVQAPDAAKVK